MGSGASSLNRIRKAIVIRAYNLRKPDETWEDQFRRFATRDADGVLQISVRNIKSCLMMESKDYDWVDAFFQHTFGDQAAVITFVDFIRFLETGKTPALPAASAGQGGGFRTSEPSRSATPPVPPRRQHAEARSPGPPAVLTSSGSYRSIADASSIKIEHLPGKSASARRHTAPQRGASDDECGFERTSGDAPDPSSGDELEDSVLHINLSSAVANPQSLPQSVKLHSVGDQHAVSRSRGEETGDGEGESAEEMTVILHPSRSAQSLNPALPLWRKVETVIQERIVHYTTIDANGEQQELIERETTQSEVLHMECKETGEFAHRETTQFEQMETFNSEVVNQVKGAEEYVHLKSKEDEYHHMESTMPSKADPQEPAGDWEGDQEGAHHGGPGGGHTDDEHQQRQDHGDHDQAAVEAEYAEAFRLYQQKQREATERHQPEDGWGQHEDGAVGGEDGEGGGAPGSHTWHQAAPSPRPPPFSDDSAQGVAYGFSGRDGGARRGAKDGQRAEDAFAFVEEMEQFAHSPARQQTNAPHNHRGKVDESPEALYGDRIEVQSDEEGEEDKDGNDKRSEGLDEARRRAIKEELFAPSDCGPSDGADPAVLTRNSSYESLHDID